MKNKTPFLSIIVPAYNVEAYLQQCVDSILQQTFTDFELILVDDGSKDSTGKICDEYAGQDERVIVIHKENGGLVSARKAGIQRATGEYATYVDGDDWIAADMFSRLCAKAKETNADIVIADYMKAGNQEEPQSQNMQEGFYSKGRLEQEVYPHMLCEEEYFSFGFQPSLWGKIFKREILFPFQMKVNEKIRLGEDAACSYACLLKAETVYYLKHEYLYFYRMRESSISHSMIHSYFTEEILLLINSMKEVFEEYPQYSMLPQLYFYTCYMFDNMITPNITMIQLFFSGQFKEQLKLFSDSEIGRETIDFCKNHRTSSRAKRILAVADKNSICNRMKLYLFRKYEKLMKKRKK